MIKESCEERIGAESRNCKLIAMTDSFDDYHLQSLREIRSLIALSSCSLRLDVL